MPNNEVHTLKWTELVPWPGMNARKFLNPVRQAALAASFRVFGILQPLLVKLNPKPPHWIIAGECRWSAAKGILDELPVLIRDLTEEEAIAINLTENIERNDLTPMEEAHGLQRLLEKSGKTQVEVAQMLSRTQGWVSNRIRLLRLPKALQELFDEEAFTSTLARDLILPFASLPDPLWDVFSQAVGKMLVATFKKVKRGLTEEEIRVPASMVAMAMSGWLDSYSFQEDTQDRFPHYLLVDPERWKDAPTGTIITYLYGKYPHHKSTRAFDMEWWEAEMSNAKTLKAQEDERKKREIEEGDGTVGVEGKDLEWTPAKGPIPVETIIPFQKRHVVYSPSNPDIRRYDRNARDALSHMDGPVPRKGNLWADHTVIPDDNLVIQLGEGGTAHQQGALLCTDHAIYEAAVLSLTTKRDEVVKRRLDRQIKADLEHSKKIRLARTVPSLLAIGTALEEVDFLTEAAEDLGISPTWAEHSRKAAGGDAFGDFDVLPWAMEIQNYLASLKKVELDPLAKLIVYRFTRSASGSELNIRKHVADSVAFEMRATLIRELEKRLVLPVWKNRPPKKGSNDEEQ